MAQHYLQVCYGYVLKKKTIVHYLSTGIISSHQIRESRLRFTTTTDLDTFIRHHVPDRCQPINAWQIVASPHDVDDNPYLSDLMTAHGAAQHLHHNFPHHPLKASTIAIYMQRGTIKSYRIHGSAIRYTTKVCIDQYIQDLYTPSSNNELSLPTDPVLSQLLSATEASAYLAVVYDYHVKPQTLTRYFSAQRIRSYQIDSSRYRFTTAFALDAFIAQHRTSSHHVQAHTHASPTKNSTSIDDPRVSQLMNATSALAYITERYPKHTISQETIQRYFTSGLIATYSTSGSKARFTTARQIDRYMRDHAHPQGVEYED